MDHNIQIIGGLSSSDGVSTCRIEPRFQKALKGLDGFSHALVLVLDSQLRLRVATLEIASVDEVGGAVAFSGAYPDAEVVDIKPFIPCEDLVTCHGENAPCGCEPQAVATVSGCSFADVGRIVHSNGGCHLQFDGKVPEGIGGTVRVAWVFSRFECARYRRTLLCTPPYRTKD